MTLDAALARDIAVPVDAGFDEKVSLPSLLQVTRAVARFTADWCGLNRI